MTVHFEELWEQAENLNTKEDTQVSQVIEEVLLKANLYKVIDLQVNFSEADKAAMKLQTMGEILLSLAAISLKDNINTFEALGLALKTRA